jgi:hypothetical protein
VSPPLTSALHTTLTKSSRVIRSASWEPAAHGASFQHAHSRALHDPPSPHAGGRRGAVRRLHRDDNLAATGRLLVFRIPAQAYESEALELVIHDPSHPAATASLII